MVFTLVAVPPSPKSQELLVAPLVSVKVTVSGAVPDDGETVKLAESAKADGGNIKHTPMDTINSVIKTLIGFAHTFIAHTTL